MHNWNLFTHSNRTKAQRPKGYALATMLILLGVAMFSASASVGIAALESKISRSQKEGVNAYYVAESAVQDAVYKLNTDSTFTSNLATNGFQPATSYTLSSIFGSSANTATVRIESTSPGYATITATGIVNTGSFQAQRVVQASVYQAATVSGATGSNAMMSGGAISITNASSNITITGGDMYSAGSVTANLANSGVLSVNGDIRSSGSYSTNGRGTITANSYQSNVIPSVAPPSAGFSAYRAPGGSTVVYDLSNTSQRNAFRNAITSPAGLPGPITRVIGSLTVNSWAANQTLRINGLLIVDGSLTINAVNPTIIVSDPGNGRSGILVDGAASFSTGTYTVNGIIYSSGSMSMNNSSPMTINGALVAGGATTLNTGVRLALTLNSTRAAAVLGGNATYTTAINHWEEEY